MKQFLRHLAVFCRPFAPVMTVVLAVITVEQLLMLAVPYLVGRTVKALGIVADMSLPLALCSVTALVYAGHIAVNTTRYVFQIRRLTNPLSRHINRLTMEKLGSLSIGQHTAGNSGLKQTVINSGQQALTTLVSLVLHQALPMAVELVVVTGFLLAMNVRLGLIMLTGSVVFSIVAIVMNTRIFPRMRAHEKMKNQEGRFRTEFIRYMPTVIASGQEARAVTESDASREKVQKVHLDIWIPYVIAAAFRDLIIVATRWAVVAYGCKLVVIDRVEDVGSMVALWYWANGALNRVNTIGGLYRELAENAATVAEYFELMDTRPRVLPPTEPVRPTHCRGKMQLEDVWFSYPARRSVRDDVEESGEESDSLRGIDLTINPGECIAVVGPSGAGKSTLVKLLLRADDPQRGRILVDGTDLRQLDPGWLRSAIGVVEQDIKLFDKSLRYNLTFALDEQVRAGISDAELDTVARLCRIDDFLDGMERRYETIIGEHGVQLSGGQRQRVGIARAVIKNPSILILDEATSNLDAESEELIRTAMDQVRRNRTTVIVAHRFSTIRNADRVLVMDGGRIVDQGTHRQLEGRCDVYQRLLRNQRLTIS